MFKHLKDTNGACLTPEDFESFTKYVKPNSKAIKTALLYGYLPSPPTIQNGEDAENCAFRPAEMQDVVEMLMNASKPLAE